MGPGDRHHGTLQGMGLILLWQSLREEALELADVCRMDPPAGADQGLGSAAQKAAGEAQAQSMSTRGFINPGADSNTPDSTNTAPVAGVHIRLRVTECAVS